MNWSTLGNVISKLDFVANYFPGLFLGTNLVAILSVQSHCHMYTEDS